MQVTGAALCEDREMLMRRLLPEPCADVDPRDVYRLEDRTTAHLRVNMVASVDGAAAVEGRVGALSGQADQVLLHDLRVLCDVLLVGAGTVRAEGYGPLEMSAEDQRVRVEAGRLPVPRLAILTRTIDLDLSAPVFTEATRPPLLLTTGLAPATRRRAAEAVAEVVVAGEDTVDLKEAVRELVDRGLPHILSEGGPHVLAELFLGDVVDELCLAIAPVVTNGTDLRITAGPRLPEPVGLSWHRSSSGTGSCSCATPVVCPSVTVWRTSSTGWTGSSAGTVCVGFPLAVVYKFFDDQGNYLAAMLTYYAFVAIFPLLLIASSVLGFVLQGNPGSSRRSSTRRWPVPDRRRPARAAPRACRAARPRSWSARSPRCTASSASARPRRTPSTSPGRCRATAG